MSQSENAEATVRFLPDRLAIYDTVIDVREIPVSNRSGARLVLTDDGKSWVRKGEVYDPLSTVGEAVSWQLAKVLSVAIPQGAIFRDGENLIWMSEYVMGALHWSPNHITELHDPNQIGKIVALDVLICNSDRHVRNLLAAYRDEGKLDVWAIDHDSMDCVNGARWKIEDELQLPTLPKAASHIFTGIPSGYFSQQCRKAAAAFSKTSSSVVDAAVAAAYKSCDRDAPDEVIDLIGSRLVSMVEMMDAYLENVKQ